MRTPSIIRSLIFISLVPSLGWTQQPTSPRLEKDKPIERTIGGTASHNYTLKLKKGQFCYAEVDQRGVDVVIRVFAPDGKRLQEIDSPNGTQGPEPITLIADTTGDYRFEVSPLESNAPAGHYVVRVIALRPAATTPSGKIDQLLAAWDKPGSPGAAVAVMQNGKLIFKKGYGYANLRQMHGRFTLNNGQTTNYAFALVIDTYKGLRRVGHSGSDAAFRSHLVRFPDQKFAVAILCNTNAINPSKRRGQPDADSDRPIRRQPVVVSRRAVLA